MTDLIAIGAMKCGTTALFEYVRQIEGFVVSSLKETDYFKNESSYAKGCEWYDALFPDSEGFRFEASPNYSKRHIFKGVSQRIHAHNPACRFVYLVRDPADRIVSHYLHNRYQGRERLEFSDAIRSDSNYVQSTRYFFQLQPYIETFGKKSLLVLDHSDLRNQPAVVMRRVCDFMSPNKPINFSLSSLESHVTANKGNTIFGKVASKLLVDSPLMRFVPQLKLPEGVFESRNRIETPDVSEQDRDYLREHIGDDLISLESEFGVSLTL